VIYAVKSGAVINDATRADAIAAGIDQVATIVENGSDAPGTILSKCSSEFTKLYDKAPMIIVKGQGNYEMLSENGPRLFFLLQAKCVMIAHDLNVPKGSFIVKQG
jgi:uncharacterized protein with ATP-grasp and redox domains